MLQRARATVLSPGGMPVYVPPQPSERIERVVNAELRKRYDRFLSIRWMPFTFFNERHERWEGRYALVCSWAPTDVRHRDVPTSYAERYDIISHFCEDVHDPSSTPVEPEAIMRLAEQVLGACDNVRHPALKRMKQAAEKNRELRQKRKDEWRDEAVWHEVEDVLNPIGISTHIPKRLTMDSIKEACSE